jgi:SAM-dependent methyltransferase
MRGSVLKMAGIQPTEQLRLQARSLSEHHRYLIGRYASECRTALEVGCGPGAVMRELEDLLDIKGVDIDPEQISKARSSGLDAVVGNGMVLPFPDSRFDLVLCSFYLMWSDDIARAVREMVRVASRKVIVLAEPVWSRTLSEPKDLNSIVKCSVSSIRDHGGEPDSGLEVLNILRRMDLPHRYGTVPLDTSPDETREYVDKEIDIMGSCVDGVPEPILFHVPFIWAVVDISG